MAIYHFNAKIISRGNGSSAIASAAYRSGSKLVDEWVDETKDFSRKKHVMYSEILLPDHAPKGYADRGKLWNMVEQFEKKSNAQLAREIEFSLPVELPFSERLKAAKELAEFFRKKGMVVDMNIHEPDHDCPNPHCHMMMTMRPFQENGTFVERKSYRRYILDENGEKIPNASGKDFKFEKVTLYDWDDKGNVEKWRHEWESIENRFYEKNGLSERVSCESYEAQGIDLIPTIHEGAAVRAMERKGIRTEIGNLNREIKAVNELTIASAKKISALEENIRGLTFQKNSLQQAGQQPDNLLAVLREWQTNRSGFIQEKGIHQKTTTKTNNLKEYSEMVSFLQQNHITEPEQLQELFEQYKHRRSEIIGQRRENSVRRKDLSSILGNYEQYKLISKYYATYAAKEGKEKQKFYDKYHDLIEQAGTYRTGILNLCKRAGLPEKIAGKAWQNEQAALQMADKELLSEYQSLCNQIGNIEAIQKVVAGVYRSRQAEQKKELVTEKKPKRKDMEL